MAFTKVEVRKAGKRNPNLASVTLGARMGFLVSFAPETAKSLGLTKKDTLWGLQVGEENDAGKVRIVRVDGPVGGVKAHERTGGRSDSARSVSLHFGKALDFGFSRAPRTECEFKAIDKDTIEVILPSWTASE